MLSVSDFLIVVLLLFAVNQLGSSLKIGVTTQYPDDTIQPSINIRCVPETQPNRSKLTVLLKVFRDDGTTIASIQGHDVIYYDRLLKSSVTAEGHLDRDVNKTFLSVTVNGAVREDSGIYTCVLHYVDDVGNVKQIKASENVTISDQSTQDVLRNLVGKVSILQNVMQMQQEKIYILEHTIEQHENVTKQNYSTVTSQLAGEVGSIRSMIQEQGMEIREIERNGSFVVAFSYGYADTGFKQGETVLFKNKIFDTDSCYNSSTGIFTAPIKGLYAFHIMAQDSADVKVDLLANDKKLVTLFLKGSANEDQGSASTVVLLEAEDTVKPFLLYLSTGSVFGGGFYQSMFTGYLLKPL